MNVLLIGAGGYAKAVCEAIVAAGDSVTAYADPNAAAWLAVPPSRTTRQPTPTT